ncbi:hypothetical protein [Neolewinella sp.]|uniref:hypothetical protein n=1 Tax=Neolewinella sp. TaxID=2993543 RepID=UPI003B517B06
MRYSILIILSLTLCSGVRAQDARNRELGLRFTGLEDFDLIYKKSLTEDTYRRYRFFTGQLTFIDVEGTSVGAFNAGASIGKETRRTIADRVQFVRGPEFFLSLGLSTTDDVFLATVQPGIGYVLGFLYQASDHFLVGIETIPSVSLLYGNGDARVINFSAGFSSQAVALTAVYRFTNE